MNLEGLAAAQLKLPGVRMRRKQSEIDRMRMRPLGPSAPRTLDIRIGRFPWTQIDGDMNPSQHGATIARGDGVSIELLKIQPVREYVGDREALDVGHPFWTREASYTIEDLSPATNPALLSAMQFTGLTLDVLSELDPARRALALANALLDYGAGADEGPAGWAKDVVPGRVRWWGSKKAQGYHYLADEDREYKQLQREARREQG